MSRLTSEAALLTFQDAVAGFSQQERELLHNWQKDLYANLMKEIHKVLMSLGPVVAATVFSLRAKENDAVWPVDIGVSDRSQSDKHSPSLKRSGFDVLTINRGEPHRVKDPPNAGRMEKPRLLDTEEEFNTVVVSDVIKEEREAYPLADQCSEEVKVVCQGEMVGFTSIAPNFKEKEQTSSMGRQDAEMKRGIRPHQKTSVPLATPGTSQTVTDDNKKLLPVEMDYEQEKTVRRRMSVAEGTTRGYLSSSEISIGGEDRCPTPKKRKSSQEGSGQAIKTRRLDGAAKYKTKFQPAWAKEYPVCGVNNDPFSYKCLACLKVMKCDHQGVRDVQMHCSTEGHRKRVNAMKSLQTLQFGGHSQRLER
ncbi:hypothetical protein NDU88_000400 [Pleurodeles waltl]|uniref:KRAB domain-containing protein n=1 Tax=Pleurodeles waltl TaxID=8319 RepID=A0AAV7NA90_PLEWA|nr:hypothetical protein NDU88_000400 [Pleurodeles waltl]